MVELFDHPIVLPHVLSFYRGTEYLKNIAARVQCELLRTLKYARFNQSSVVNLQRCDIWDYFVGLIWFDLIWFLAFISPQSDTVGHAVVFGVTHVSLTFHAHLGWRYTAADQFAQVDPTGHDVWVAGSTKSPLDGNSNAGGCDIFLMRFQVPGLNVKTE